MTDIMTGLIIFVIILMALVGGMTALIWVLALIDRYLRKRKGD